MIKEKGDHLIDETKLSKNQAQIFISLLLDERYRHQKAKINAKCNLKYTSSGVASHFYKSCIIRHQEDIDMIDKTINYLRKKYKFGDI